MPNPPDDRCGYTYPDGYEVKNVPGEPELVLAYSQNCCYRETLEDVGLCAWHADPNRKSAEVLQNACTSQEPRELLDGAILSGITLKDSISFEGLRLREADFTDSDLRGAVFTNADLRGTDFTDADLRGAVFTNTDLRGADLTDTKLQYATLTNADVRGADIKDANLTHANLEEGNLQDTDFTNSDLRVACFTDADLRGTDFTDADLRGADLTRSDLGDALLLGTDLREATLNNIKVNQGTQCEIKSEYDFSAVSWDSLARTHNSLKTAFNENGLIGEARRQHLYERQIRGREARARSEFIIEWLNPAYLGNRISQLFTGYGFGVLRLIGWMVFLFGISTIAYWYGGIENSIYYSVVTFTTSPPASPPGLETRIVASIETFLGTLFVVLLGYILGNRERF